MFNKNNKNNDKISKRLMTDNELIHLTSKIKHNLSIIEGLNDVGEMRYYLREIASWVDEIHDDNFKGYY